MTYSLNLWKKPDILEDRFGLSVQNINNDQDDYLDLDIKSVDGTNYPFHSDGKFSTQVFQPVLSMRGFFYSLLSGLSYENVTWESV